MLLDREQASCWSKLHLTVNKLIFHARSRRRAGSFCFDVNLWAYCCSGRFEPGSTNWDFGEPGSTNRRVGSLACLRCVYFVFFRFQIGLFQINQNQWKCTSEHFYYKIMVTMRIRIHGLYQENTALTDMSFL